MHPILKARKERGEERKKRDRQRQSTKKSSKTIIPEIANKREISDISQKVLTTQLKELEQDGIIERTIINDNPPKTIIYDIAEEQSDLIEIVEKLCDYTKEYAKKKSIEVAD